MITIPPFAALIFVLTLLYGSLFHLWRGRTRQDLLLALAAALVGLILGQLAGPLLGLHLLRIGQLYFLEGTLAAWVLMLAAIWLKG